MLGMTTEYKLQGSDLIKEFKDLSSKFYNSELVESSCEVNDIDDDNATATLKYRILKDKSNNNDEIQPLLLISIFQHRFSRFEVSHGAY